MKLKDAIAIFVLIFLTSFAGQATQAGQRTPKEIQQVLSNKGFNPGTVDGIWGRNSAKALKDFQRAKGLAATGKVDDATIAALFPGSPRAEDLSDRQLVGNDPKPPGSDAKPVVSKKTPSDGKADRLQTKIDRTTEPPTGKAPATGQRLSRDGNLTPEFEIAEDGPITTGWQPSEQALTIYALAAIAFAALLVMFRQRSVNASASISHADPSTTRSDASARAVRSAARHDFGSAVGRTHEPGPRVAKHSLVTPAEAGRPVHAASTIGLERPSADSHGNASNDREEDRRKRDAVGIRTPQISRKNTKSQNPPDDDALTTIEERNQTAVAGQPSSLAAHNAGVKQWVTENAEASSRRYEDAQRPQPFWRKGPWSAATPSAAWMEKDSQITVAGVTISKGLIYTGNSLAKDGRPLEPENCLINPALRVAQWGDREGRTMGYWPSYSSISPEARRSYLEWLAGDRSDPNTYIGYVFLYFYGLERRLMFEKDASDAEAVIAEVRRLTEVYRDNHAFSRYANELLAAFGLQSGEPSLDDIARIEPNGYEVPLAIRIALGVRVRDGRVIEPDLLFRFAMTHPHTRVRTPAKRSPELVRQLFAQSFEREYPSGYRYKAAKAKPLQKCYRACSASFEVEIEILGGSVPDIAHHAQPIGTAHRIFDACSDALDEYSRALGKLPGFTPNLMAVSKLPKQLRAQQARLVEGSPLDKLTAAARDVIVLPISDVARTVSIEIGTPPSKSKLREVAQLLGAFGFGATFDPDFAQKPLSGGDPALVFKIGDGTVTGSISDFRAVQLTVMLGLVVGHADGHFHAREREILLSRIDHSPSLTIDERTRLRAEILVNDANPARLDDWMKRLKDVTGDAKISIADALVAVATADGILDAREIRKLEIAFQRMGLPSQALYDRLHSSSPPAAGTYASPPEHGIEVSATPAATGIDRSKLRHIRSETRITAGVLAGIFADEETSPAENISELEPIASEGDAYEGLQQRYGALLNELRQRRSWSALDFDHLARDAGLLPGAAREAINDWALDRFDDLILEGDDPIEFRADLLASPEPVISTKTMEGMHT